MEKSNLDIFNDLKRMIVDMEYKPGDLVNEKELIDKYGVSRTPVREALIKLSQLGLVDIRPRVGTYVSQVDLKSVKNAYEIKKSLEGLAAELAAVRAKDSEIEELFKIIERFETYDIVNDYKLCIKDDQKFHTIVRSASGNSMLIEILDQLNLKTERFLQYIQYVIDDYKWFYESLKEMADAIKSRNPSEARRVTEDHTTKFLIQMSKNFFI